MKLHHSYRALLISASILIGSGHNDLAYGQENRWHDSRIAA